MNTIKSHYSITNKGHEKAIVFIHGLFTNQNIFERSIGSIEGHTSIFIDLFSIAEKQDQCDLKLIAEELISIVDELSLKGAIFVATGIGKDITFQIGIKRPDLIRGQVFIGSMDNQLNPMLKSAELELFKYLKDTEESKSFVTLLEKIMNLSEGAGTESYIEELLGNIKQNAFINLYQSMHGRSHFSRLEYWNNTIPNVFIVPGNSSNTATSFINKLGYNRSIVEVKDSSSENTLLYSKEFSQQLRKSLSYFN